MKEGKIFVFRPSRKVKMGRVEKDPNKLQEMYDLGVSDCKKLLPNITFAGKFAVKARRIIPPLFILLLVGAFKLSSDCPYAYSYNDLKTTKMTERQEAYFRKLDERISNVKKRNAKVKKEKIKPEKKKRFTVRKREKLQTEAAEPT